MKGKNKKKENKNCKASLLKSTCSNTIGDSVQYSHKKKSDKINLQSFDYQHPDVKPFLTNPLSGRWKTYHHEKCNSQEADLFRANTKHSKHQSINPLNNYDSKRTLIPNYNTETDSSSTYRRESKFNKESKEFGYISSIDIFKPKKKTNSKCYSSSVFDFTSKPRKPDFMQKNRSTFTKYNVTTQIENLPGCVKRQKTDINDDDCSFKRSRSYQSFQTKTKYDHNTNISCLPGCKINPEKRTFRKFSGQKNKSSIEVEKDNYLLRSIEYKNHYRSAGKIMAGNENRGKKFVNLQQWKKDYYAQIKKLFNNVKTNNGVNGEVRTKFNKRYKNQSQIKFI